MRNTLIFIVFMILMVLPCAAESMPQNLGNLVQFKMDGDTLNQAALVIPASPWDTPTIISTHSGEGNACTTGPGCWSRFLDQGTFVFDVTKDEVSIGTITLNGYWFATTKNAPTAIFNHDADIHTMQMWGDFNVNVNYDGEILQGDFMGIMEYWNPVVSPGYQVLDLLDVNDVLPYDVLRFSINMTRGLPGNEIIVTDKKEIGLDNLVEDSENIVQISKNGEDWGTMIFSNHADAFDELIGKPGYKNQSTYITQIRMENLTDYWIVEGWAKTFFVDATQKYRTVMTAGMVVEQGKTGIVDNDGDEVYSNTDCNDDDDSVWVLITGYIDSDEDTYTSGSGVELCTDGNLPYPYLEVQTQNDCDDEDSEINPSADEVCGNSVDEDCSGSIDNGCGSVNGIVYRTDTWNIVSGIQVYLTDVDTEDTFSTTSGESGEFSFILPVGVYELDAAGECYSYPPVPPFDLLELPWISVTDGGVNSNNYAYVDYTCGVPE
ncbi:MAG: hypothetical protein KKE20_03045 [Nanoarchaeota archaeon]|nr:hypothetical protein [Nanoarchaeota archaeon]